MDAHQPETDTALAHFAGTVAHELNNIFTAIVGNLSLLDLQAEPAEDTAATVHEVTRIAQRGIDLSARLQAFAGRQALRRKLIDVNATLAARMHRLAATLPETVTVELCLAPDIGNAFLDEEKLLAVVDELVRNACDAMPGGGTLHLETLLRRIEADQKNARVLRFVEIRLRDSGTGMSPEVLARAFQPLFSTKGHSIHLGWGLSNCMGFVRQSGGQMALSSHQGAGTQVQILLPLAE